MNYKSIIICMSFVFLISCGGGGGSTSSSTSSGVDSSTLAIPSQVSVVTAN